jgi:hypothetical protein
VPTISIPCKTTGDLAAIIEAIQFINELIPQNMTNEQGYDIIDRLYTAKTITLLKAARRLADALNMLQHVEVAVDLTVDDRKVETYIVDYQVPSSGGNVIGTLSTISVTADAHYDAVFKAERQIQDTDPRCRGAIDVSVAIKRVRLV